MTEITEQKPYENDNLLEVDIHQNVLINYDNLPDIYRSKFEVHKELPIELAKTYPKPLIFYHHTEDRDHLSKLSQLKNIVHEVENQIKIDHYTDDGAEANYLSSKPVSFLIIGKPDIGQTELGQLISENWQCVPINPELVIKEEINSDTRAGKCIKYNLESGRSIGPEVVLRLVEKRLKSQSIQHRGYVLSGFPMLRNEFFKEDPISSESAVFNVQEIFEELLPRKPVPAKPGSVSLIVQSDISEASTESPRSEDENETGEKLEKENDEEEAEKKAVRSPDKKPEVQLTTDLGPSDTTIVTHSEPFHSLKDPKEQLIFLQNLLETPLVLIYVTCSNIDVRYKREKYRFNIYLRKEVLTMTEEEEEKQFKDKYPIQAEPDFRIDGTTRKMQVKLPIHYRKTISSHLWQFKCHVHKILDQFIMKHNPEHFMKIDGRSTAAQMYDTIFDRIKMLSFQPVLIPEKLIEEDVGEGVQSEPIEELPPELSFKKLRDKMIIGPMYKYQLSNWTYKCPVALKEGRNIQGKSEFAVRFMNKIFYLSSEDALIKFYRNPRQYLLPIMPQPASRFWVLGPKYSGKSVVAKCLSLVYDCKILDPAQLEMRYIKRKEEDYVDKIRSAAMTKAIGLLNKKRENEKKLKINAWKKKLRDILSRAHHFNTERNIPPEDISEEDQSMYSEQRNLIELNLQSELKEMALPSISQADLINELLIDANSLLKYLPEELRAPTEPATVFDSFVTEFVAKKIETTVIPNMELTVDEKVEMFKIEIDQAEETYNLIHGISGGWIIDGMLLDIDILVQLSPSYLPDDVICLQDEDREHVFLIKNFKKKDYADAFTNYKYVFQKLKMDDLAYIYIEYPSMVFIESILTELQDRAISTVESETFLKNLEAEQNKSYGEEINKFNERYHLARRVPVPDSRFDYLCEYYKPASKVPAFLNVVDIAGLVKGASEGQGLGNAFLSHISACDAIFHLCRAFEDDDVTHVEGDVNPVRDLEIIFEELRLKDEDTLMKNIDKVERVVARGGDKKMKPEYDTLMKVKSVLVDEKKHIRFADWNTNDIEVLNKYLFLTSKPGIYLINLSEKDYIRKKNKWLAKIKEWVDKQDPGSVLIPFSGAFEHKLLDMEDPGERSKYLEEVGATSALDKIIVQGYRALQLEYFFTAGVDEVKAWTIQKGTKAPQAAGKIHTDFEKGFIMAEVMKFQDFKEEGTESGVKAAGKYRQQGRNYVVEDGDIIFFKFNAGAGIKDGKKK